MNDVIEKFKELGCRASYHNACESTDPIISTKSHRLAIYALDNAIELYKQQDEEGRKILLKISYEYLWTFPQVIDRMFRDETRNKKQKPILITSAELLPMGDGHVFRFKVKNRPGKIEVPILHRAKGSEKVIEEIRELISNMMK